MRMKKIFILVLFFWAGTAVPARALEPSQELKGDHFIVYYTVNDAYAREVLRKAEYYYDRIASDLGYIRYSDFWQWDNRVKIAIYAQKKDFTAATGQPEWSVGNANYTTKTISSYADCAEFLQGTLPHEIGHLIFRDFVGFKGEVPLWLDEGVAQWQEPAKRQAVKFYVRKLYDASKLLPLKVLMRPGVLAGASDEQARNFYIQAMSLVGFMIEHYGADRFTDFCRQLRDGNSLDDSLRFAYPDSISSLGLLEKAWLNDIAQIRVSNVRTAADDRGNQWQEVMVSDGR